MNASEDLDKITINSLRVDMARVNVMEYRGLVVLRDRLLRELNQKIYAPSGKKVRG